MTLNGLDVLIRERFKRFEGHRLGVLCNQASISRDGVHILDAMFPHHHAGAFQIIDALGPQHGIWGHTQDNMIEWEGYVDSRTGIPFHSLYGEVRTPRPEWLNGLDILVVDLVDVGSRYYTFMWSMVLCMAECERQGVEMVILDRVNPIGGVQVEGPVLEPQMSSLVGLHPLPIRHGMTIGELALHFQKKLHPNLKISVVRCAEWNRAQMFNETGLMWAMPSPNMPSPETALVYPGGCLIEGTNLSEGRGTTRPFETIGAPFIDGWTLADDLASERSPGVVLRPIQFLPNFHKHKGELCGGIFVHPIDRQAFRPILTYLAIVRAVIRRWPREFGWSDPPYEYVLDRMPFDILIGNTRFRPMLEAGDDLCEIEAAMASDVEAFAPIRAAELLY
jgi:uncharacterized protein YbbC (DUF1343 family)